MARWICGRKLVPIHNIILGFREEKDAKLTLQISWGLDLFRALNQEELPSRLRLGHCIVIDQVHCFLRFQSDDSGEKISQTQTPCRFLLSRNPCNMSATGQVGFNRRKNRYTSRWDYRQKNVNIVKEDWQGQ